MKNMFLKELKLDVPRVVFLFPLFGLMMFIPNYPLIVGMGYSVLAVFIYFQYIRENRALEFSAMLPIKRSHIVASTALVIFMLQSAFAIIGGLSAVAAKFLYPDGNLVGLDANCTFFGVAFSCFGVFNIIFLPYHYKSGVKLGMPILLGLIAFLCVYGVGEAVVQAVPALRTALDSYDSATLWARLTVLGCGIAIYALLSFVATKRAVKNFEKVNL